MINLFFKLGLTLEVNTSSVNPSIMLHGRSVESYSAAASDRVEGA